jgi:hypothetical protein
VQHQCDRVTHSIAPKCTESQVKPLLTGWSLVRIRPGEPALSRTYAQYFEFFVLKPRELDTPSFKPLIAFGVSLGRNAAQAFFSQAYSPQLSNLRWLCAACACDSATSNRRKRKAGRQLLGNWPPVHLGSCADACVPSLGEVFARGSRKE